MTAINRGANKFYVGEDIKDPLAEITFVENGGGKIVVDHTFVSGDLRGKGMGGELLGEVVKYAREKNKKVLPLCPYAKGKMEKTPEFHDVLIEQK